MTTPQRRRYIAAETQDAIEELIDGAYSPKQIEEKLHGDEEFKSLPRPLPTLRTIQRMVAEKLDESGPWELDPTPDIDSVAAFAVLSEVIRHTEGRVSRLSRLEARWVTALVALRGELPAWEVYRLAREYILRRQQKQTTADLDAFLAFAPWQAAQSKTYMDAVLDRLVPPAPTFLWELVPGIEVPGGDRFTPRPLSKLSPAQAAEFKKQLEQLEAHDDSQR